MRLENYLTEKAYENDELKELINNTIVPTIKKDCSQYLKEGLDKPLIRGKRGGINDVWEKITPREYRKPSDTPEWVQDAFDDASKRVYGTKFRSQGVFTSPLSSTAGGYGTVCDFYPINGYKYIWSPDINDFFKKYRNDISQDPMALDPVHGKPDPEYWDYLIRHYYQNYHLSKNKKNEVMFYCPKGYYLVDTLINYEVRKALGFRI